MKDTNKVVLGVATTFVVVSVIAVSQGGSIVVSAACTLAAIALSLAYKYKCERDNGIDVLEFLVKSLESRNSRIEVLEDLVMDKINESTTKDLEPKNIAFIEVAKKPRRYKSKAKPELV